MTHALNISYADRQRMGILTLNRPERHNALDLPLMRALTEQIKAMEQDSKLNLIMLNASGQHFCAGADIQWMQLEASSSHHDIPEEMQVFSDLLEVLSCCTKPVIALVQGRVLGGGLGLLSCCDAVIAASSAIFQFSEVKLGLMPAIILPYIIRSIGYSSARYYCVTAQPFSAEQAQRIGLVHRIVPSCELSSDADRLVQWMMNNSLEAMQSTKQFMHQCYPIKEAMISASIAMLSTVRASETAQEGIKAFLDKRSPRWIEPPGD